MHVPELPEKLVFFDRSTQLRTEEMTIQVALLGSFCQESVKTFLERFHLNTKLGFSNQTILSKTIIDRMLSPTPLSNNVWANRTCLETTLQRGEWDMVVLKRTVLMLDRHARTRAECCPAYAVVFFSVFLGSRTAWMFGRTPPWAMVTPDSSLFSSSSLRMANCR